MKSLFLILVLIIFGFASDIEGFRDMRWGDSPSKLGKYVIDKKYQNENKIIYKRQSDELKIGNAKLDAIFYDFFADRLKTVIIKFSGNDNLFAIKQAFESKYGGRGFIQPNKYLDQYFFVDGGPAKISIMCGRSASDCYVFISNDKLVEEADAYKKSTANKGAKDL